MTTPAVAGTEAEGARAEDGPAAVAADTAEGECIAVE